MNAAGPKGGQQRYRMVGGVVCCSSEEEDDEGEEPRERPSAARRCGLGGVKDCTDGGQGG